MGIVLKGKAEMLLNTVLPLSKISRSSHSNKSLLIRKNEDRYFVHAQSPQHLARAALLMEVEEYTADSYIPLTIIPFLTPIKNKDIRVKITDKTIRIEYDSNKVIRLKQYSTKDITIADKDPRWFDVDFNPIKKIIYAAGDKNTGYDCVWLTKNHAIATDTIRFGCYYHNGDIDLEALVQVDVFKLVDNVKIGVDGDGFIWVGDEIFCIQTKGLVESSLSEKILSLANSEIKDSVVVNTEAIKSSALIAKNAVDKDNIAFRIHVTDKDFIIDFKGHTELNLYHDVIYSDNIEPYSSKINCHYFNDAIQKCDDAVIGKIDLNHIYSIIVIDNDSTKHFIMPMYDRR